MHGHDSFSKAHKTTVPEACLWVLDSRVSATSEPSELKLFAEVLLQRQNNAFKLMDNCRSVQNEAL